MPKLFQINITANWGSHGKIAEEIGQLAISRGWESYIAYGRWLNPSESELIHIGSSLDEKCHGLQSRLFDNHGLASIQSTKRFINEIEQIKPDIIHLHNIHGYYLNYPILFECLKRTQVPVVWTLHDCWAFTGHCAYFTFADCSRWKTGCHDCPNKKNYPASLFLDRSKRNYDLKKKIFNSVGNLTLVPVSEWLRDLLSDSYLKDIPKRCIHNGIDLDVFKESDMLKGLFPDKKIVLGVCSVWERRKGMEDFIKLRSSLDGRYLIVLIGLTKKQIESLPEGIIGIERTNNVLELAAYYSRADVFVNPTYEDNFPTTNLEALACGTPVVTYNTGGSPEAIDERTGLVIPTGDEKALADGIIMICTNNNQKETSMACRLRAEQLFNKNDRYQEYMYLYESLLR